MAKTILPQFSFNRGEVEPALHGRSDWKYYFSSAKKIKNMIARMQGPVVKRPGMRFVAYALNQGKPSFLIPFTFSVKQAYMLEFGDYQMRIIMNGALVVYPEGHDKEGQIVVVETPYSSDDLSLLRFTQTADVMYITISSHRPRRLMRHDHHDWRFDDIDFDAKITPPNGLKLTLDGRNGVQYCVTAINGDGDESAASDVVTCEMASGTGIPVPNYNTLDILQCRTLWVTQYGQTWPSEWDFFSYTTAMQLVSFMYRKLGFSAPVQEGTDQVLNGPDGTRWKFATGDYVRAYNCVVDYVNRGYGGILVNMRTLIRQYVEKYNENASATGHSGLEWNSVDGATAYYVFRSVETDAGTRFYFIGSTNETTFDDDNLPYDSSRGLPETNNPFDQPGNYPGVCALFEQRMIYARSDRQPTTMWGSDAGNYNSFTQHTPIEETDAYEFTMDSGEMNEVLWIVPINELLLGTSGSEWRAGGSGTAITPLNINMRPQSWIGCANISPVVFGRTVIFVTRSRRNFRTFSYSLEADGYSGADITSYAGHLFEDRNIIAITGQQLREGIIWAVMADGTLLSATFNPDEDVIAWTRHETKGKVEFVRALKDEDGMDQLYLCTAREINGETQRLIEVLEDPATTATDVADMYFVDCGVSGIFINAQNSVAGLDHLEGESVVAFADGNVLRGLVVENGRVTFPNGMAFHRIHVGLPYEAELETQDLEPIDGGTLYNRQRWIVSVAIRFIQTRQCLVANSQSQIFEDIKFREEPFDTPIEPFTGTKRKSLTIPSGAFSTSLILKCGDPVPFGVAGIIAEAGYGQ